MQIALDIVSGAPNYFDSMKTGFRVSFNMKKTAIAERGGGHPVFSRPSNFSQDYAPKQLEEVGVPVDSNVQPQSHGHLNGSADRGRKRAFFSSSSSSNDRPSENRPQTRDSSSSRSVSTDK